MDTREKLMDMMDNFDTAMLVTHHPTHGLDARPMAIAGLEEDGSLWFATKKHSGKMIDIKADSHAAVTLQGGQRFISMSGTIRVVEDRARIEELWQESWKVWFPGGKSDPSLTLLHLLPSHGEYWDNSGFQGVKYLVKAGKAYVQGDTPDTSRDEHARVSM